MEYIILGFWLTIIFCGCCTLYVSFARIPGRITEDTPGMVCPQCHEIRNHGASHCYLCNTELITEIIFDAMMIESEAWEDKIALQDYIDNEPVAQFKARGMALTRLCDRHGQIPEAIMVQQASKLTGHRIGKANLNNNHHVPVEYCLDQVQESFSGRFETEDELIHEIESVAKAKKRLRGL